MPNWVLRPLKIALRKIQVKYLPNQAGDFRSVPTAPSAIPKDAAAASPIRAQAEIKKTCVAESKHASSPQGKSDLRPKSRKVQLRLYMHSPGMPAPRRCMFKAEDGLRRLDAPKKAVLARSICTIVDIASGGMGGT